MKRFEKILRRISSKRVNTNRKARPTASRISNESRFALGELSNLTKLAPDLTGKFNQIIKSGRLYPETKIVIMTGDFETDGKACKIASKMHGLKDGIASAVWIANKTHSDAERTSCLKEAERLENNLNHLKKEFRELMLSELHKG